VTFTLVDPAGTVLVSKSAVCQSDDTARRGTGTATVTIDVALPPGDYMAQVRGNMGFSQDIALTVVASATTTAPAGGTGSLPTTGSNTTTRMATAAAVSLVTGVGILVVTRVRRRPAAT
jgi:LPXTG-motif cell wall-anchored protein